MTTTLRAIIFGAVVAASLTITLDTVTAAEPEVVRLETVRVIAHRDAFDADGNLKVERLPTVHIDARKSAS